MSHIHIPNLGPAVGYTEARLVDIGMTTAVIVFTHPWHRIHDTTVDFPSV